MKRLYLYGPPASGKTTLAKKLSAEFKIEFADLDEKIVAEIKMPISEFFSLYGEEKFREIETKILKSTDSPIVSLGGGTLLKKENREFAETNGFVAVLDVDAATIEKRIAAGGDSRPLGNKLEERREHYSSFAHHVKEDTRIIPPGFLAGKIEAPTSKSSLHRFLIADFLASLFTNGSREELCANRDCECEDIAATRRCLGAIRSALATGETTASLDCGESGSTLRFLSPVCAALGIKPNFIMRGRLAERPVIDYRDLKAGEHVLRGDISSQFVTGLLFALPLLDGDSTIRFSSPLQSRGYVDMTLRILREFGISIEEKGGAFYIRAHQRYVEPRSYSPEGDWSGAAFWIAANRLGANIDIANLSKDSAQPDRVAVLLADKIAAQTGEIDISPCPDLYPALAIVAARTRGETKFVNASRLRIKESDRIAAMEAVFTAFGVKTSSTADTSIIWGTGEKFSACEVDSGNDHRIAMAAAIGAINATGPVLIHRAGCIKKSYPRFFEDYAKLFARVN